MKIMKRVKKILYNLGFAALLGLGTVPSLLAIHLLASSAEANLCYMNDYLSAKNLNKTELVKPWLAPLAE